MKTKYTLYILSFLVFSCFGAFAQNSPTLLDYSCSFDNLNDWTQGEFCNGIWKIGTGTDGRSYNNLDKSDSYLYICNGDIISNVPESEGERKAILSKNFDFSTSLTPILSFAYYYYFNNNAPSNQPHFIIESDEGSGGSYFNAIFSSISVQTPVDDWTRINVCLPSLRKKTNVQIRICVVSYGIGDFKIAFDNFSLSNFAASTTSTPASCFGYTDGDITITVNGAGPKYDFSCDNGVTWETDKTSPYTFSQKKNGDYNIVVRDVMSECVIENLPVIVESPSEILFSIQTTEIKCMNDDDGTITVIPNAQVKNPQYSIDGGAFQTNNKFENLSGGEYVIKVQDGTGCISSSQKVKVGNSAWMEIESAVPSDITTCYGNHDGSIKVTARAYNSPVSYSFNGSGWDTHETKQGLAAGEYTIRIKDSKNCILEYPTKVTINQPDPIMFVGNVESTDVTGCYGNNNGEIEFAVSGGTAPYKCSVDGGLNYYENRFHFKNLSANMHYIVRVQDNNGCECTPKEIDLQQPTKVEITNVVLKDVGTCFGDKTGSITITATGGTNTFEYSLMPKRDDYQQENVFSVGQGYYYPAVTDGEGCKAEYRQVEIRQPKKVSIISCSPMDDLNKCHGDANGLISVQADGGTLPYYFTIDNFANNFKSEKKFYTITNLSANDEYKVQVKDENGCLSDIATVSISEPPELLVEIVSQTDASCYNYNDAHVVLKGEGGTPNYSYAYSRTKDGAYNLQAGNEMDLKAGTFYFKVVDAHNCESLVETATLGQPQELSFSVKKADVDICYGDKNGRIVVSAVGGNEPYRYYVSGIEDHDASDNIFDNLGSGLYHVSVVDNSNCKVESRSSYYIAQPPEITLTNFLYEEVKGCKGANNGSISFIASGGTGELSVSIDGKNFITTSPVFKDLPAGKYKPIVVDSKGCKKTYGEVEITEPEKLEVVSVETTDAHCFGTYDGSALVKVRGGKRIQEEYPYKFYFAGMDDPVNYDGIFKEMGAGTYDLLIVDDYKCTIPASFTINEPDEIKFTQTDVTDVTTCYGDRLGTATLKVSGGVAPFTYSINSYIYSMSNETGLFTGLPASTYEFVATDANECSVWASGTILQPEQLVYSAKLTSKIDCHGDNDAAFTITATGGTTPYKYSFDDGATYPYTETSYTNVQPGVYKIKAMDANGCTQNYNSEIKVVEPPLLEAEYEKFDLACNLGNTGKIISVATGGTKPYLFSLDEKNWQYSTGAFSNLTDSTYTVTIKDANNCQTKLTGITLLRPPNVAGFTLDTYEGCSPLKVTMTQTYKDGITTYSLSNGDKITDCSGPVSYVFRNTTGHTMTYTINASMMHLSGAGCTDTSSVQLKVLSQPLSDVAFVNDTTLYPETSAFFANLTRNIKSVKWDFGDGTYSDKIDETSHTYQSCGNYNIVLVQSDGVCNDTIRHSFVIEGRPVVAAMKASKLEGCQPVIVRFQNTSTHSDSCSWDFGDGSTSKASDVVHIFEGAGDYNVTLTAYGDCGAASSSIRTIHVYPKPSAGFNQNADTLYEGQYLRLRNESVESNYFDWNFGDGHTSNEKNPIHKYEFGGRFTITLIVTSANSCTDTSLVSGAVTVIENPIVVFPNAFTPDGDGINDVFVPTHGDVVEYKIAIFNRRGQVMYRGDNINEGWDGTRNGIPCPLGVYVYKANIVLRDKSFYELKGYVVLLRQIGGKK